MVGSVPTLRHDMIYGQRFGGTAGHAGILFMKFLYGINQHKSSSTYEFIIPYPTLLSSTLLQFFSLGITGIEPEIEETNP
jgi:hypothetical protein